MKNTATELRWLQLRSIRIAEVVIICLLLIGFGFNRFCIARAQQRYENLNHSITDLSQNMVTKDFAKTQLSEIMLTITRLETRVETIQSLIEREKPKTIK